MILWLSKLLVLQLMTIPFNFLFLTQGGTIVKLNMGTWHAGPLFQDIDTMDFFSLELSDTNIIDHNTYDYSPQYISFEIVDK
jgi:hypothetical protein